MNTQSLVDHGSLPSNNGGALPHRALTIKILHQQNLAFQGTRGVSAGNRSQGFAPAFLDMGTGKIYLARYADGRPAPIHLLEGLPQEVAISRDAAGRCTGAKHSLIAGFVRVDKFYTREQAANQEDVLGPVECCEPTHYRAEL